MKAAGLLALMLGLTWGLVGGIALVPGGAQITDRKAMPTAHTLQPVDKAILRDPFASRAARIRLAEDLALRQADRRLHALLPAPTVNTAGLTMGWTIPDQQYWQQIPPAARDLPQQWTGLPVVRFTNTELGGVREVRFRQEPEYDQWLLSDPLHTLTACISVQRRTRRVYFMEIARQPDGKWGYHRSFDNCYSCHPSGPRVIRPLDEPRVDSRVLAQFNRRILAYGACAIGDVVDPATRGEPIADARCTGCHNGVWRGKLYQIHNRAIRFKTEKDETMPPPAP